MLIEFHFSRVFIDTELLPSYISLCLTKNYQNFILFKSKSKSIVKFQYLWFLHPSKKNMKGRIVLSRGHFGNIIIPASRYQRYYLFVLVQKFLRWFFCILNFYCNQNSMVDCSEIFCC